MFIFYFNDSQIIVCETEAPDDKRLRVGIINKKKTLYELYFI